MKIKHLVFLFFTFFPIHFFGQDYTAKDIIPDSITTLKKGIYFDISEFLNNKPAITPNFEVINDNPDYIIFAGTKNDYYVTYYDAIGLNISLPLEKIWGYYNGFGVFISFQGKPFEILSLGAISLLRYEHDYNKYNPFGRSNTTIHQMLNAFLDIKNDSILIANKKNFESIISQDSELFQLYRKDKKKTKFVKTNIYLRKYNQKHPLFIAKDKIELSN